MHMILFSKPQTKENEKKSTQKLPDLKGVEIFVTGAHSKNNDKFFAIRDFWLKFFKACDATCQESNYSSTAISLD